MLFIDEIASPPPPLAPAPAGLPFDVKEFAFGLNGTRPAKVRPSGQSDYLSDDELLLWQRAQHLEQVLAGSPPDGPAPELPFLVRDCPFGTTGRTRPAKQYGEGGRYGGPFLEDDEVSLWEHLQRLEQAVAQMTTVPSPAAEAHPEGMGPDAKPHSPPRTEKRLETRETTAAIAETNAAQPETTPVPEPAAAPGGAKDAATEFLRGFLADGPQDARAVAEAASAKGISESTLKRSKAELGVVSRKNGIAGWIWELPTDGGHASGAAEPSEAEASAT
jgi:hypothetical protein